MNLNCRSLAELSVSTLKVIAIKANFFTIKIAHLRVFLSFVLILLVVCLLLIKHVLLYMSGSLQTLPPPPPHPAPCAPSLSSVRISGKRCQVGLLLTERNFSLTSMLGDATGCLNFPQSFFGEQLLST